MTWYIAITNPNCHRRAECELASLGYRAFWPKMRRWVSHARTKTVKEYPIMGRYLFVEIPDRNFWAVRNVNGIEGFVTYTDDEGAPKPARVPEERVWSFRVRYMAGEWDFVRDLRPVFDEDGEVVEYVRNVPMPIGARVRIMEGEFADMLATVRGRERGKLKVLPLGERNFLFTRDSNVRAA